MAQISFLRVLAATDNKKDSLIKPFLLQTIGRALEAPTIISGLFAS